MSQKSRYPSYTNSESPFIGDVPTHWRVLRLANLGDFRKGRGIAKKDITEDGLPAILYGDIYTKYDVHTATLQRRIGNETAKGAEPIRSGDILLTASGETVEDIGKTVTYLGSEKAYAGGDVNILRPRIGDSRFLSYSLNSHSAQVQKARQARGEIVVHIYNSSIRDIRIPYPPLEEQQAIATWLDERTARIDTLIAKKQRLIELLQEKRQAIISKAVTRGLDPHVKLKDSGIPWLGEVPEHWEVDKFSRIVRIAEGQVNPEVEPFLDMLLIAPNHIQSRSGQLIERETAAEQGAESGKYLCPSGSVIYSKIRPALRKATIAPEECLCSADMYPMTGVNGMTNPYLLWLILSDGFSEWVVLDSERVAMPKVNRETLNDYWLPLPPTQEQEAIVSFIDDQTSHIDSLLDKAISAREKLQEYRSSLISAAVTGQIKVC